MKIDSHKEMISVTKDKVDSIKQIKKACIDFKISFSSLVVELVIIGFETGRWGVLVDKKNKKNIYTTEDILHDTLQNDLHKESKWIKL